MPESFDGVTGELRLSPEEIEAEFLNANPWLTPDMIAVTCRREALRDVRICFGRDLFPMSCGKNEETRSAAPVTSAFHRRRREATYVTTRSGRSASRDRR